MIRTWLAGALTSVFFLMSTSVAAAPSAGKPDGKAVFVAQKCDSCHSVKSAGIEGKSKKVVDLSGVSSKRKAEWVKAYLAKTETLDGKAHPPKFKGTDADLTALVDWLMSLKPAP